MVKQISWFHFLKIGKCYSNCNAKVGQPLISWIKFKCATHPSTINSTSTPFHILHPWTYSFCEVQIIQCGHNLWGFAVCPVCPCVSLSGYTTWILHRNKRTLFITMKTTIMRGNYRMQILWRAINAKIQTTN